MLKKFNNSIVCHITDIKEMKVLLATARLSATFVFLILFTIDSFCQSTAQIKLSEFWEDINACNDDSLRADLFIKLSNYSYNKVGNNQLADSAGKLAIENAIKTKNNKLILEAHISLINQNHTDHYYNDLMNSSKSILVLVNEFKGTNLFWEAHYSLSKMYTNLYDNELGLKYGEKAHKIALESKSKLRIAKSLLVIGKALEGKNYKLQAYKHYLDAFDLSENLNNKEVKLLSLKNLFDFYIRIRRLEKANEIVLNQKKIEAAGSNRDSLTIMWLLYRVEEVNYHHPTNKPNKKNLYSILEFANRNGFMELKESTMALYRGFLLKDENLSGMNELYTVKYPNELEYLRKFDLASYYRTLALISEDEGNVYDALKYWKLAEPEVLSHNKIWQANFYNRFGQFLNRNKMQSLAIKHFNKAYKLSEEASYFTFMIHAVSDLESIYKKKGDYHKAYYYSGIKNSIKDSMAKTAKMEDQVLLELDRELKIRQRTRENEKKEEHARLEKQTIQKKALAGILIVFFFSGILLFRQYKQTRKAKHRSDKLLLNILPEETAEELKEKGYTTARNYEDVTVLYADIKGFTKLASLMSPEDLVNELNDYFTAFDEIVKDMGLEKIKTIGDAYIAVGGLPEKNTADAITVARAAIAMRNKVIELKENRIAEDKPFFEMRTGLNSGPVVAGTVGTVKFQYDIWGDTVNMAARMEENCEVGKINISHSTYLKINHSISCKSRGEIHAKNKGNVPMYYINL